MAAGTGRRRGPAGALVRLAGRSSERAPRVPRAARRRARAGLRPALHPRLRAARARRVRRTSGRGRSPTACNPDAFYRPQLDADRVIGLGTTPTARLQGWLFDGHLRWHDHALIFLHSLHFAVPLGVLFAVWLTCRPFFVQAAAALLATSFAAALGVPGLPRRPTLAGRARGAAARRRADPGARRGPGRARRRCSTCSTTTRSRRCRRCTPRTPCSSC